MQGHSKCIRQESCQTVTWTGHPESRFTFDLVADENVSQVPFFCSLDYVAAESSLLYGVFHTSNVTGEVVQSGWLAHGGELRGRLQQLHVCLWPSEFCN